MKYTDQELLNQINSLADSDQPPTCSEFRSSPETASVNTVSRRFGSWNKAIQAAGYLSREERLSEEKLLNQINSLADGNQPPTQSEFKNCPETVSIGPVKRVFDSWNGAIRAAGYSPKMEKKSEEEVIDQINSLADGNQPPTQTEFRNCPETVSLGPVRRIFDSWNGAIRAAGYSPRIRERSEVSKEEVIDQINFLADGNQPPTRSEFKNCPETLSIGPVYRLFDRWNEAVRAAGYAANKKKLSGEEVIDQIDSLAEGDQPPTQAEFRNSPETMSFHPVKRLFDTWNEALEAAGYSPQRKERDKQELLAALQRAADAGDVDQIKKDTVISGSYPSKQPYLNRFGGLPVAAVRGSIDFGHHKRHKAVPLTKLELNQFVDSIPDASPRDQAVALIPLLTGCAPSEHKWVDENGVEDTETDSVILFPPESKRGGRSVSVGPLYNQFIKMFDSISPKRIKNSIEFSSYPLTSYSAAVTLRRLSKPIDFDVSRPIIEEELWESGPRVLHRDLRCTHYLFEYCRGASQAMLKRRLALSDNEVEHYHRYLDDDEDGWTVTIEWRD